jgi:hypothetical protein
MLTDPKLRAQVDALKDKSWTGGLTNVLNLQEEFVPSATLRGCYATGVVARVEGLRGRMPPSGMISEAGRQALC